MTNLSLSPEQQRIVNHNEGPALVVAVAGAGKTRVVAARAERLAETASVLLVTFSRAGADEMRKRISNSNVTISTAHALAYRQMKHPKIEEHRWSFIVDRARRDLDLHDTPLDELLDHLRLMKSRWPMRFLEGDPAELYELCEQRREQQGVLTFDDLLRSATEESSGNHAYDFVIQDEAQDQNEVQEAYIRSFVSGVSDDYMAVGDPWQTCHEFRGAAPGLLSREKFLEHHPQAVFYTLSANYRSTPEIVAFADMKSERRAEARRDRGSSVATRTFDSLSAAAAVLQQEARAGDTVLYRAHAESGILEAYLKLHGRSFKTKTPFAETTAERILSYLWLAARRGTASDVRRSINWPFRFVKADITREVERHVDEVQATGAWAAEIRGFNHERLSSWARTIDTLMDMDGDGKTPLDILTKLLDLLGRKHTYGVRPVAALFTSLDDMLDMLDLPMNVGPEKPILLSTIHDAKGREWARVNVLAKRDLPGEGISVTDEEARLKYVAYTRAMNELKVFYY